MALSDASILKNFGDARPVNNEPDIAGFLNKSLVPRNTHTARARGNITGFKQAQKNPHGVNHAGFKLA